MFNILLDMSIKIRVYPNNWTVRGKWRSINGKDKRKREGGERGDSQEKGKGKK